MTGAIIRDLTICAGTMEEIYVKIMEVSWE